MTKIPFHNKLSQELAEAGIELKKDVPGLLYGGKVYKLKDISLKKALQAAADPACKVLEMKGQAKAAPIDEKPAIESPKTAKETSPKK